MISKPPHRKPTFFTSDWHIGHKNCLEFDKRPFANLNHMHKVLIDNYNMLVPKDGICYFLGDMGLCKGDVLSEVIDQLNGTKVLILGNHDKGVTAMHRFGFDAVLSNATMYIAKQRVTLSHCPLRGIIREDITGMKGAKDGECWHGESRHLEYSVNNEGQFHLHGHIHSPNGGKSTKILDKQYDVGVVANGYRPVTFSTIESWIAKYGR